MPEPLWRPDAVAVARSSVRKVMTEVEAVTGLPMVTMADFHDFSVASPGDFWDLVWGECGVIGDRGDGPAVVPPPPGEDLRATRFFPAATLNYAQNLLAGADLPGASDTALVFRQEDGQRRVWSWGQLREAVGSVRSGLMDAGVGRGDVVAAWMPNVPETVITMLAAEALGAVFTSTSPDFGPAGVLDRFAQVAPKILVAADGYFYGGKRHDRREALSEISAGLPSLRQVWLVGHLDPEAQVGLAVDTRRFSDVLAAPGVLEFEQMPFDAPGFILYSSGTTGVPKCIEHRSAGFLLKHAAEQRWHMDIRAGDRVFWFTTCGWMMWNWLVSALAVGATVILYDGSPFHSHPDQLWEIAEQEQITMFGVSAKYLDACAKQGLRPGTQRDLSALRTVGSTGSPLSPEGFEYVYREVKADVHLASISGGTDICGCFALGDPTSAVWAGELQAPALGADVDVLDADGTSHRGQAGVTGELVCRNALPSMPIRFINDPDDRKYTDAYFNRFPGLWNHGDFAMWTEHDGIVILGRSDATLNAGGVRIGTAEIYRQVESLEEVVEAIAIGQSFDDDTRIVLFVRLLPGHELDDLLRARIAKRLRERCSPRHVPARIVAVADLPRTRSGKLAELAVADVVHGRPVRNTEALANPESLRLFEDLEELTT
ncbi:MAG: acetoacetate--CoA ligase [Candidatus Nanopelagicales bacterium]|nr:acetoacetate--CoA ligase [Candidatus Nanopelagicales bacterium]